MSKHVAIYVRVSSKQQDQRSQEPDLRRWPDVKEGLRNRSTRVVPASATDVSVNE